MTTFRVETIQSVMDNFALVQQHWDEIVVDKTVRKLDPHWEFFQKMERIGGLVTLVARDSEGVMLGYAVFLLSHHLHDRTMLTAHNDAVFLRKDRRVGGVGYRLLKFCDEQLPRFGVNMINWHVKTCTDFGPALIKLGYKVHETIYTKFVGG